ncbi:transcriptional regulator [Nocardioides carbamazepini]|uniref:transcriptional regulator n=1 Tax=Nocardioides carbamazepini TaxID=2854259 RepID=UPI00214A0391|nr:transcriptional regulator [Nocardioides carbamazepini]
MDTESLVIEALQHLGVDARPLGPSEGADAGGDLLLVEPDGIATAIDLKRRSLVDEKTAERLLADHDARRGVLMVVADRVTEHARRTLSTTGTGYYDLRGHLALHAPGVVLNTHVPAVKDRPTRTDALAGKAGLEVATALLMTPDRAVVVRELARGLERSASTVSNVLAALRRDDLLDDVNTVAGTELFWQVAQRWPAKRTYLARAPLAGDNSLASPLRFGIRDPVGWALTDSTAATAYGAPLASRADQVMDFFVPDESVLRRATNLLSVSDSPTHARATIRLAPVPAVVSRRVRPSDNPHAWPLAHPLFVALDLAQDRGRGREILEAWTPAEPWRRVW